METTRTFKLPVDPQCVPLRSDLINSEQLLSTQSLLIDRIRLALLQHYDIKDNPVEWRIARCVSPYPIRLDGFGVALCEHGLVNEDGYLTFCTPEQKAFVVDHAYTFKQMVYTHPDNLIPYGYLDLLSGFFRCNHYDWATENWHKERCDLITNEGRSTCLREMSFTYPT